MRIRTVKPEWLDDERLVLASSDARVLSIALLLLADDYGRGRANRVVLAARVFPGKIPETLANALDELAKLRFVLLYEVDGQSYFEIRNWARHQKVDKPGKPQVPAPPKDSASPENIRETLAKVPESLATDQDQDQDQEGTRTTNTPRVCEEAPPVEPEPRGYRHDPKRAAAALSAQVFRRLWEAARGETWSGPTRGRGDAPEAIDRWAEREGMRAFCTAEEVLECAILRWSEGEWCTREAWPWASFSLHYAENWRPEDLAARFPAKFGHDPLRGAVA